MFSSMQEALIRLRKYLDEILETLDIMSNPETMRKIAEAEKQMKRGEVMDFDDLLKEFK